MKPHSPIKAIVSSFCLVAAVLCASGIVVPSAKAQQSGTADKELARQKMEDIPSKWEENPYFRETHREHFSKAFGGAARDQCRLGLDYYGGWGVARNYEAAAKWFRKAADQNLAEAQSQLGSCYYAGNGVEKNYMEAEKWFRKAAEQNYPEAQFMLGICYHNGRGVEKNTAEAVRWYRKSAEKNMHTQYLLAECYANGNNVEQKDQVEAVSWYLKAAAQDHPYAQNALGRRYFSGQGVEKNYTEAYAWWNLVAKSDEDARKSRDELEGKMSPQQVDAGQKRTQELRAQIAEKLKSGN